jgi:hypothetical protein
MANYDAIILVIGPRAPALTTRTHTHTVAAIKVPLRSCQLQWFMLHARPMHCRVLSIEDGTTLAAAPTLARPCPLADTGQEDSPVQLIFFSEALMRDRPRFFLAYESLRLVDQGGTGNEWRMIGKLYCMRIPAAGCE